MIHEEEEKRGQIIVVEEGPGFVYNADYSDKKSFGTTFSKEQRKINFFEKNHNPGPGNYYIR